MNDNYHGIIKIHIAVLLFGLAGLFGKIIVQQSVVIVFGRVLFASLFLLFYLKHRGYKIELQKKSDYINFVLLGALLTLHWISFFKSIQLSTVAIGLLTFSTFPVFVTFIEPCFFKGRLMFNDILIAVITFLAAALVVPGFQFNSNMTLGALLGILSGLLFALLSILNRKYTCKYSGLVINFYETAVSSILLFPFIFIIKPVLKPIDIMLLILLGVVFTGISHSLFISGMSRVKAQTASIIATLEPVYGILSTIILFGEIPTLRVIFGGLIILSTSFYSSIKEVKNSCK